MTFIEKYNDIMGEGDSTLSHAPIAHVKRTFDELLQSVGSYTDKNLGDDAIPLNALVTRPEGGELKPVKDEDKRDEPKTKRDLVARQIAVEFEKDGIPKEFRADLIAKGYKTLVDVIDKDLKDKKIWRDMPTR